MADFATAAELATFTGDSDLDGIRGDQLVAQASAVIRNYTRQTIELVEDDQVELRGRQSHRLKLPERPIVDVTEVLIDGTEVTDYRLVRDTLVRTGPGVDTFDAVSKGMWGSPDYVITVTYSHGFSTIPSEIKGVCLQVAARAAANPQDFGSFGSPDGLNIGFNGALRLTAGEQAILDRFRHEHASA